MTFARNHNLISTISVCVFAAAVSVAVAPSRGRAAVVPARDIPHACSNPECTDAPNWGCCVFRGGVWVCDSNCKPKDKQTLDGAECIGIAPGEPIPPEIQKDLDRQAANL
jgi:hypothetical protein